ncbi:hypothetical protein BDY24DRAFT_385286 [Mrakia frigida]|uniref:uncharacterized protein n=1 Tax=Mrakia frigida TaxID=29902 RepID=UPI003FCC07BD
MSLGIRASEVDRERWVRVCCGRFTLHECKYEEAMHFEGNNYYPYGSRLQEESFTPSDLFWKHSMMGLASFFHFTKPDRQHPDPSPGYEFLTLYVGYDMNKTFVKIFDPVSPPSSSSPASLSNPIALPASLVDGFADSPSASTPSDRSSPPPRANPRSRTGSSSGRSWQGAAGGSNVGMERVGSGSGNPSASRMQVDREEVGSEGGSSAGSGVGPGRGRTNRDMPVRRASLGGRGA